MSKKKWWQFLSRRSPKELGLALGGGGVRGLAHIGVLKVLERENVSIHQIAGTSAGGLIGALYACGLSAAELEQEALLLSNPPHLFPLLDRSRMRRGLFVGPKLITYLSQWLGDCTFDQLRIPLAVVTADLTEGQQVILKEGTVLEAIRATIAVPGLFTPVKQGNQLLVDGGLLNNLPVDVVRGMGADVVIGVDVATGQDSVKATVERLQSHRLVPEGLVSMIEVLWRSLDILMREANRQALKVSPPDLLLCPAIPSEATTLTGMNHILEIIAAGKQAMEEAMPQLKALLNGK